MHDVFGIIKNHKGATAIEYAPIANLIAVVAIVGMRVIGTKILDNEIILIQNHIYETRIWLMKCCIYKS